MDAFSEFVKLVAALVALAIEIAKAVSIKSESHKDEKSR